jgi:hypothetical protein
LVAACGRDGTTDPSASSADGPDPAGPPWFEERAQEAGIDFAHVRAFTPRHWFPEIMGGGGCWIDHDGDGDLDLYLVQSGDLATGDRPNLPNRLYRNERDGTFVEVTEAAGVGDRGYGMGCAVGDYDGDGDLDLYVTNFGPDALLRNRGDGTFTDATAEAGLGQTGWGTSAAFVDYDGDDHLDLFVVNYVHWTPAVEIECFAGGNERTFCNPSQYNAPAADVLYRNRGDGTFADVTEEAGIWRSFGNGLGVASSDFDGDGRVDLYVANDGDPNQLWINRGDGTFTDEALLAGAAVNATGEAEAGMGVAVADVDGNGASDLFVTHLRDETNTLYLNRGGVFDDATSLAGLAAPSVGLTGFGTAFVDFDHDGELDLLVANGRVGRSAAPLVAGDPYAEPNQLFRGLGGGRFEEVAPPGGTREPLIDNSRAALFGDYDGDGAVDVAVVNNGGPLRLLRNRVAHGAGWVRLHLRRAAGRPTLHARVQLRSGGRNRWRQVQTAYSYCASNEPAVHLGVGNADRLDLEIEWPDAHRSALTGLRSGREYVLHRPSR